MSEICEPTQNGYAAEHSLLLSNNKPSCSLSSSSLTRSIEKVEATSSLIDIKNSTQRTELEGPLAIFVEDIWKKEATTMRFLEKKLVQTICKWNDKFLDYSRELEKKGFIRNDVC